MSLSDFKLEFAPSEPGGDPADWDHAQSPLRPPEGAVPLCRLRGSPFAGDGGLEGQRFGHQCEDAGETTQNIFISKAEPTNSLTFNLFG